MSVLLFTKHSVTVTNYRWELRLRAAAALRRCTAPLLIAQPHVHSILTKAKPAGVSTPSQTPSDDVSQNDDESLSRRKRLSGNTEVFQKSFP